MDLKRNSNVVTCDGHKAGTLRRVVLDPATKKVSALVIERGLLFTEDRLVPMDQVERVEDDQVVLKSSREGLDQLKVFEVTRYIPLNEDGEQLNAYYWNPPVQGLTDSPYPLFPHPVYVESTRSNIPENSVALKEGAHIITGDGKHAGDLERVITDPATDQVTHLVVSGGFLSTARKLVPAYWIKDVMEDEIHLSVESGLFDRTVEFQPEK